MHPTMQKDGMVNFENSQWVRIKISFARLDLSHSPGKQLEPLKHHSLSLSLDLAITKTITGFSFSPSRDELCSLRPKPRMRRGRQRRDHKSWALELKKCWSMARVWRLSQLDLSSQVHIAVISSRPVFSKTIFRQIRGQKSTKINSGALGSRSSTATMFIYTWGVRHPPIGISQNLQSHIESWRPSWSSRKQHGPLSPKKLQMTWREPKKMVRVIL